MTFVRLGYVAMSVNLEKSSPSQTMTYAQYLKFEDKSIAISKLERIANSNLENCLRLLKHNASYNIKFFRLSSRLVPLATHSELKAWDYLSAIKEKLAHLGAYANKEEMRIDFHPDHFVLLNSPKDEVFVQSIETLQHHHDLLKGMDIDPTHRCILHIGGKYKNTEKALEAFCDNWEKVPEEIQKMIILENDDKSFHLQDTLFLCEKLGIPLVFDYHHHIANNQEERWEKDWERVVRTWSKSKLSVKMHISSPKSEKEFRHHADYVDVNMFVDFLQRIKGSVETIDCMVEAKQKDAALFKLVEDLKKESVVAMVDEVNFNYN